MDELPVIVTASGAPGGPCIIKSLKKVSERKLKVIATDVRKDAAGLYIADKYYLVPMGNDPDYIQSMTTIARKEKAKVLLPLSSVELPTLAKNKQLLKKIGVNVLVSEYESVSTALNKYQTYKFLIKQGLKEVVPRFKIVHNVRELKKAMEELGYPDNPIAVKPPASKGQRGFRILVSGYGDFKEIYESKPSYPYMNGDTFIKIYENSRGRYELLVMEYLPGKEFTVDALCYDGDALIVVPRERIKVVQGISVVTKITKNEKLIDISKRIIKKFNFKYIINLQFKYDSSGKPKLLEINPRIAGTACATIEAGAHLPYLAIKMALGEKIKVPKIRWGMLFIRYWDHVTLYT